MTRQFRVGLLILLAGFACRLPAWGGVPLGRNIPLADFFGARDASSLEISPDGKAIAFLTTLGNARVGITVFWLDTGKFEPLVVPKDGDIKYFFWKGNERIIYGGDLEGNESNAILMFSIKNRKVKQLIGSSEYYGVGILDILRTDPNHILLDGTRPVRLNIETDRFDYAEASEASTEVGEYLTDRAGVIRLRLRLEGDAYIYEAREGVGKEFRRYATSPINQAQLDPQFFNADNETVYFITHDHSDTGSLRAFDMRTHEFGPVLFHDPTAEIERVLSSRDHRKITGVLIGGERPRQVWFDPARAELQARIDSALPETFNQVVSTADNERIAVVMAYSDRDPGTYYVLNLDNPARGRPALMQFPIRSNMHLAPAQLQPMQPIAYPARDGLVIHGYLTLPAGAKGRRLPFIINPHGGPFGIRDQWGYDAEVQFLVSRGYAVLQPNYRGSGGYGENFQRAGYREWGGKMQDDLVDGVRWAIAEGIADPKRVCIYGGSYGGYAALVGVTQTPDLFCCAINYAGVSDLRTLASVVRHPDRPSRIFFDNCVGKGAMLDERSPVNHVDQIRVPTLHAYGANDPRVIEDHWKRLEAALKRYHKNYDYIRESKEGHGFGQVDARLRLYSKMEQFLATNLAPAAPAKDPGDAARP